MVFRGKLNFHNTTLCESILLVYGRAEDLIGKPAALERFTLELLENPVPPADWQILYDPISYQVTRNPVSGNLASSFN